MSATGAALGAPQALNSAASIKNNINLCMKNSFLQSFLNDEEA
jgi:hypothetical protein